MRSRWMAQNSPPFEGRLLNGRERIPLLALPQGGVAALNQSINDSVVGLVVEGLISFPFLKD